MYDDSTTILYRDSDGWGNLTDIIYANQTDQTTQDISKPAAGNYYIDRGSQVRYSLMRDLPIIRLMFRLRTPFATAVSCCLYRIFMIVIEFSVQIHGVLVHMRLTNRSDVYNRRFATITYLVAVLRLFVPRPL